MEFAVYVLVPEGSNSKPKVWGGFSGVHFAFLLEDAFWCEIGLCFQL